jgi:hypothetical protein
VLRVLRTAVLAFAASAFVALAPSMAHADPLPEPQPVPSLPAIDDPDAVSTRLIPVPAGCAAPDVEQAVFIGTLTVADANTARFSVEQVRSGSVEGFVVDGLIDIRYGDETRFLEAGRRYIVGAGLDPELGVLASTVRTPSPLFGGNEIAGVDNGDVTCPDVESPIRTLLDDASSVESGVLSPLKGAGTDILRAVLEPVGVAFVVLLGLVLVKHLVFALGRSLRDLGRDREPRERRRRRAAAR